jgi:hypothetical protein
MADFQKGRSRCFHFHGTARRLWVYARAWLRREMELLDDPAPEKPLP